jgi:hypothetical protein
MKERAVQTIYFERPGPANTERTLEIAGIRARDLSIGTILVATTQGTTGLLAARELADSDVVAITHSTGFKDLNQQELTEPNRKAIEQAGARVLTCIHAFGGINRAVRMKLGTHELDEIIAHVLRTMGQGFKVCVEIAVMAADAGMVRVDAPCIAIGGTGRGADTAVVLTPANAQRFFDLRIHEILCKPY